MNVVAIHGATPKGQVNEAVVALIEELLARAKTGDLRSIAYATVNADGGTTNSWERSAGDGFTLMAGVMILQTKMTNIAIENEVDE